MDATNLERILLFITPSWPTEGSKSAAVTTGPVPMAGSPEPESILWRAHALLRVADDEALRPWRVGTGANLRFDSRLVAAAAVADVGPEGFSALDLARLASEVRGRYHPAPSPTES